MDDTPRSGQRRHHRHPTSRRLPSPHPASRALGAQVCPWCPGLPRSCLRQGDRAGHRTREAEERGRHTDGCVPPSLPVDALPSSFTIDNHTTDQCNRPTKSDRRSIEPTDQPTDQPTNRSTDQPNRGSRPDHRPQPAHHHPPARSRSTQDQQPANRHDRDEVCCSHRTVTQEGRISPEEEGSSCRNTVSSPRSTATKRC